MKRQRINPIKEIECKWCNKMIPSTNLSNHIKFHHKDKGTIDDYVLEFGEFRANKIKKEPKRIIPKSKFSDIHYWTWSSQTTITGTQTITTQDKWWKNIWWQLLAVSPSAFLQKVFINIIPGNKWNYSGTDDVTGKTWSMKIFGKKIKVPRLGNMKVKLIIAVVCVGTFLLVEHNKIKKQQKEIQKTEYKTKRPQV